MRNPMPEVAAWYQDVVSGSLFEVVAIDEANDTIEIQLVDGEVGEYDMTTWRQLYLSAAEAPEDWRSPYGLSVEDSPDIDSAWVPDNLSGPLSDIEPDVMDLDDDFQNL